MVRTFSFVCLLLLIVIRSDGQSIDSSDRRTWLLYMDKIARPVMSNLAGNLLKDRMPVTLSKNNDNNANRMRVAYLEAFGRTLSGIAPWLNGEGGSAEEMSMRNQYRQWALKGIANAVNPQSPDYMVWEGGQPLVDASFFALGLIRCPWLWENLPGTTKAQVVTALRSTRNTVPAYSNWLLFTAMVEAFFCKYGYEYDKVRIDYAIREFAQHWYVGDGMFSDGMNFAFDYYNSYVIQPYLATILQTLNEKGRAYEWFLPRFDKISKRYAEIQERLIHTDGSFPVTGRSITYRGGAFHHLADMASRKTLPSSLPPPQVRAALSAVLRKTMASPTTFTDDGWLRIGVFGSQPGLGESYINTGSVYLCASLFLPLGLPAEDEFWSARALPWTSVKVWSGEDLPADHAIDLR